MTTTVGLRPRIKLAVVLLCSVVVGAVITQLVMRGGLEAHASEGSYSLADFQIQYPYAESHGLYTSDGKAGISFRAYWTSTTYPGTVQCEVRVFGSGGDLVGRAPIDVSVASPDDPDSVIGPLDIPVSAPPSIAEGICEGGDYRSGPGYEFEGPISIHEVEHPLTGEPLLGQTRIVFLSKWLGESSPGMRTCDLVVQHSSGEVEVFGPYNVFISSPQQVFDLDVPAGDPEQVSDATFECTEFLGV